MPGKPENSAFKLLSSRKTLVMATADKNGAPNVSYAPFVHRAPLLYVYTSSLSRHTKNMMETAKASVMFIEDEARTRNFFARKRFTCQCSVELVGSAARICDADNGAINRWDGEALPPKADIVHGGRNVRFVSRLCGRSIPCGLNENGCWHH